jgi:hypothetical protein
MDSFMAHPKTIGLLGTYDNIRGKLNMVTLITAFVLSIMVINNYRQCKSGEGYPPSNGFVNFSYGLSVAILVIVILLFSIDILKLAMTKFRR